MTTNNDALAKKYHSMFIKGKPALLYCDECCPVCGFPATFIESRFIEGDLKFIASGCAQCKWRKDIH